MSSQANAGRPDLYGNIHKAVRLAHCRMLTRMGGADFAEDQTVLLADLRAHLAFGEAHMHHEESFVHPALAARHPGACEGLEAEHASHRRRFAELEAAIVAVETAAPADRTWLGRDLYLQFTVFVGEDLAHMAEEETVTTEALYAHFSDAELIGLHNAILASIGPEEQMTVMRLMIPAINRTERVALLGGMKANAPPAVFAAVFEGAARPTLPASELAALSAVGLAA